MIDPIEQLIQQARDVRQRAYAPYSRFAVGAALRDDQGGIHVGCNVENVSSGLTICAERFAVGSAVARGVRQFTALAVVATGAVSPCGACRQVLAEFCDDRLEVWLVDVDENRPRVATTLGELLPMRFRLNS